MRVIFYIISFFLLFACNDGRNGSVQEPSIQAEEKLNKTEIITFDASAYLEESIFSEINLFRIQNGLPPLQLNLDLSDIARIHSQEIANGKIPFSHTGYEHRVQLISEVIKWEAIGENLAFNNYDNPTLAAIDGWTNSSLHLDNILGEFNLTGVGVSRSLEGEYFITQIFVRN